MDAAARCVRFSVVLSLGPVMSYLPDGDGREPAEEVLNAAHQRLMWALDELGIGSSRNGIIQYLLQCDRHYASRFSRGLNAQDKPFKNAQPYRLCALQALAHVAGI